VGDGRYELKGGYMSEAWAGIGRREFRIDTWAEFTLWGSF
jgi:hypothetical protein